VRIHVLVEGQTEKIVFDELIAAELEAVGHYPSSSIVAMKKPAAGGKFRGGVTSCASCNRRSSSSRPDSTSYRR